VFFSEHSVFSRGEGSKACTSIADTHSGITSNMSVRPSIRYIRTVSLDEETSLCLLAGL